MLPSISCVEEVFYPVVRRRCTSVEPVDPGTLMIFCEEKIRVDWYKSGSHALKLTIEESFQGVDQAGLLEELQPIFHQWVSDKRLQLVSLLEPLISRMEGWNIRPKVVKLPSSWGRLAGRNFLQMEVNLVDSYRDARIESAPEDGRFISV